MGAGLFLFGAAFLFAQDSDLAGLVEKARKTGAPSDLAEACSKLESAVAARPDDLRLRRWLIEIYSRAEVRPLAAELLADARKKDAAFKAAGPDPGTYERLEEFRLGRHVVRVYRSKTGLLYFISLRDSRYVFFYFVEDKTLWLNVGGFGDLRPVCRLDSTAPAEVRKAVERYDVYRPVLESAIEAARTSTRVENPVELLHAAAKRLTVAARKEPGYLGLSDELSRIYDRLGERVAGREEESDYRRLQLHFAERLSAKAPELAAARRALALAYLRIGAYPWAAREARKAGPDPVAWRVLQALRAWSQDEHEPIGGAESLGDYSIEAYRTKKTAPRERILFAEMTFIVRRKDSTGLLVYTLSSQPLKATRHYYLYVQHLATRRLLTAYAASRPGEAAVRRKVLYWLGRLKELEEKKE